MIVTLHSEAFQTPEQTAVPFGIEPLSSAADGRPKGPRRRTVTPGLIEHMGHHDGSTAVGQMGIVMDAPGALLEMTDSCHQSASVGDAPSTY